MCGPKTLFLAKIRKSEVGRGSMTPEKNWEAGKCCGDHHHENFPPAVITFWVKSSINIENKGLEQFQRIHVQILGGNIDEKIIFLKSSYKLTHDHNLLVLHSYGTHMAYSP